MLAALAQGTKSGLKLTDATGCASACRARTAIERTFARLEDWRRIHARCDKLARNVASAVAAALISWCGWRLEPGAVSPHVESFAPVHHQERPGGRDAGRDFVESARTAHVMSGLSQWRAKKLARLIAWAA